MRYQFTLKCSVTRDVDGETTGGQSFRVNTELVENTGVADLPGTFDFPVDMNLYTTSARDVPYSDGAAIEQVRGYLKDVLIIRVFMNRNEENSENSTIKTHYVALMIFYESLTRSF